MAGKKGAKSSEGGHMIPTLSFDLEIQRGQKTIRAAAQLDQASTGLLGPSGCGKTTLLHCIAGLITPVRGTIKVGEKVLFDSSAGIDIAPEQRRVAVVFQDGRLFPHWSVKKNVEVGASSTDAALIAETVEMLEIGNLMSRMPDTLSGGEMQRIALARAIVMRPRWLLLDEPLGGVDNRLKNRILPLLRKIRDHSGIPILHVSHDVSELMSISSQLMSHLLPEPAARWTARRSGGDQPATGSGDPEQRGRLPDTLWQSRPDLHRQWSSAGGTGHRQDRTIGGGPVDWRPGKHQHSQPGRGYCSQIAPLRRGIPGGGRSAANPPCGVYCGELP